MTGLSIRKRALTFQAENEQGGIVFVVQGWEGDWREPATLKPMDAGSVDCHGILTRYIGTILGLGLGLTRNFLCSVW